MKISRKELQRVIREEKARLRREDTRSASRKTKWVSGDAGKKSRANRLRRLDEQPTQYPGAVEDVADAQEQIEVILNDLYDKGVNNDGLIALLQNIIKDVESGFVGEPT
tara:strand:- start:683 stop:1009 length:327 start_codon:yes stop_codon:yes gene_type:complete